MSAPSEPGRFQAAFRAPEVQPSRFLLVPGAGRTGPVRFSSHCRSRSPFSALGTSGVLRQPPLGRPRSLCVGCAATGGPPAPRLCGDPCSIFSTGRPRGQGRIIPVLTEACVWKGTGVSGSARPTGPPAPRSSLRSCVLPASPVTSPGVQLAWLLPTPCHSVLICGTQFRR